MPPSSPAQQPGASIDIARQQPGAGAALMRRVAIWPMVAVIYGTLLPREVSFRIGDNFLYFDRIVLIITVPWMLYNLWRGAIKFVAPDWLMLLMAIWMFAAMSAVEGLQRGLVSGLSIAFDAVAGYYLGRISFRSLNDMRRALILASPGFFLAGLTVMAESITHKIFVRPLFVSIFGAIHYTGGTDNITDVLRNTMRFGLSRGYGVWVHPIEASLHLSTLLGIYWMSGIRGWPRWLAVAASFMAIFAVSSAGILALVGIIIALSYDGLTRHVRELNWRALLTVLAGVLIAIGSLSKGGLVNFLVRYATLDASTGYYRMLIWQYGTASVAAHPLFGIGFSPYDRPGWMVSGSVDNHFLLIAMRYGLVAGLSLFVACIMALAALVRAEARATPNDARFYRGIAMSLTALVIMGFTVAYQGGTLNWFNMLLGGCVACAQHGFDWRTGGIRAAPRPRRNLVAARPAPAPTGEGRAGAV